MSPHPKLLEAAIFAAIRSPCAKSKRGAAIGSIEGVGPIVAATNARVGEPCTADAACRSLCSRAAVHAEQVALMGALHRGMPLAECELVHIKVVDGQPVPGGPPSCLECSKIMAKAGLGFVWLWEQREEGAIWVRRTAMEFHAETLANVRARSVKC